jgi:transcriptional regulator with XRE-family HTH domain
MVVGSFRSFLADELARRVERNRRYSLRAFARDLGVDHSSLSQWLRGRRAFTVEVIERLGARLRLSPRQTRVFTELGEAEGPDARIFELARGEGLRADSRWIAARLDIGVDETNVALQRLLRLQLLAMPAADRWIAVEEAE